MWLAMSDFEVCSCGTEEEVITNGQCLMSVNDGMRKRLDRPGSSRCRVVKGAVVCIGKIDIGRSWWEGLFAFEVFPRAGAR
jgi:hypothetical protein